MMKVKQSYEEVKISLTLFSDLDLITTSGEESGYLGDGSGESNDGGWTGT